jgi:AMP phosphorylase
LNAGDRVWVSVDGYEHTCLVNVSDIEVNSGEVGFYADLWKENTIVSDSYVNIELISRSESVEFIAKKLQGKRLNETEMAEIMSDIANYRIREAEMAYFMATMFNPGFNEEETLYAIKGMVASGEVLDFKNIKNNGDLVVDKHSIGGIAGKGVTPLLVPVIASFGLVIPNTSTRAITTPAGTSDILEVVMPIQFKSDEIYDIVRKTGACMIWGGNLKLAPADDVLIKVEKGLHVQSYQKFIISIIAKKVAMGVSHILIDIPFGANTKIEDPDDVSLVSNSFLKLFEKVGIKCLPYTRSVTCPDGRGIGPNLEIRDILRVLERSDDRPMLLEDLAVNMAGKLLEFVGKAKEGFGADMARANLDSGVVTEKFWEIAMTQGAKNRMESKNIIVGEYTYELKASKDGVVKSINNKEIVSVARALGTPMIKEAGIYFSKSLNDEVKKGEVLATLYATSAERLEQGKALLFEDKLFKY